MPAIDAVTWTFRQSRRRLGTAARYSLAFKLLQATLMAPLVAAALRVLLLRWGRASVGNFEITAFLLSPPGLLALIGGATITIAVLYLELAGLMRLLADERLAWWQGLTASGRQFPLLVQLGLRQCMAYLLLAVPFLAGIAATYWWLWSDQDLNGLVVLRPAEFWLGIGLAGSLSLAYAAIAGRWFLQWLSAVPTLLFETDVSVTGALQQSVQRTAGQLGRLGSAIGLWAFLQFLLSGAVLGLLHWVSSVALAMLEDSLLIALPATASLLMGQVIVAGLLSSFSTVTFAGLVLALYEQSQGGRLPTPQLAEGISNRRRLSFGWLLAGCLVVLTITTSLLSERLLQSLTLNDGMEITAHRGGASHAPENSVASIRRAIADRADWAEVDVQLTRDQALVILHDIDLVRIGGGQRRVEDVTLTELQAIDIGTPLGPEFAGERVPTLEDILQAAGDAIRLNIELKPHNRSDETELTRRVVAAVQQAGMVNRCRLCSQSYASLQLVVTLEPALPVGFIAATAIGDLGRLEVNFLMVKAELATANLVQRARLRDIEVHAWTVNDPAWVAPLLDRGVANLITDDPALMRLRLEEILTLSPVERLLLRVRNDLLGDRAK